MPRKNLQIVPHNEIMSIDFKDIFLDSKFPICVYTKTFLDFLSRETLHSVSVWGLFFFVRLGFFFSPLNIH
jgi:hypothetical protein